MGEALQGILSPEGQDMFGTTSPSMREILLRTAAGALPPPGRLIVPNTVGGRILGTGARVAGSFADVLGSELEKQRTDPLRRLLRVGEEAQKIAQGARIPVSPAEPPEVFPIPMPESGVSLFGREERPALTVPGRPAVTREPESFSELLAAVGPEKSRTLLGARLLGIPEAALLDKPDLLNVAPGTVVLDKRTGEVKFRAPAAEKRETGQEQLIDAELRRRGLTRETASPDVLSQVIRSALAPTSGQPQTRQITFGNRTIEVEVSQDPLTGRRIVRDAFSGREIPFDAKGNPILTGIVSVSEKRSTEADELSQQLKRLQIELAEQRLQTGETALPRLGNLNELDIALKAVVRQPGFVELSDDQKRAELERAANDFGRTFAGVGDPLQGFSAKTFLGLGGPGFDTTTILPAPMQRRAKPIPTREERPPRRSPQTPPTLPSRAEGTKAGEAGPSGAPGKAKTFEELLRQKRGR